MGTQDKIYAEIKNLLFQNICNDLSSLVTICDSTIKKEFPKSEIFLRETIIICNCPKRLVRSVFGWKKSKRYISCSCSL